MAQFTVQLNSKHTKVIEKLAEKQEISQRQVVLKAIELYELFVAGKVEVKSDSPGCGEVE